MNDAGCVRGGKRLRELGADTRDRVESDGAAEERRER